MYLYIIGIDKIRLSDGEYAGRGRLEVMNSKIWGSFCHTHWDKTDAEVACRMMRYRLVSHACFYRASYFEFLSSMHTFHIDITCILDVVLY